MRAARIGSVDCGDDLQAVAEPFAATRTGD